MNGRSIESTMKWSVTGTVDSAMEFPLSDL